MNPGRLFFMVCGSAIVLGLVGCKRDPGDIAKWKADGSIGKLISATGDHRQFVRIGAIEALAELKPKEAIEPLAALFSDPDLVIVHEAIDAVAAIEDPRIEKHMLKVLGFSAAEARTTAATALGTLKTAAAVDPLIAALDDEHETVVAAAAAALGQIGNPKAIGPLAERVGNRSFNIRMASVTSLGQIGGPRAAKGLEAAMGDLSNKIRSAVIDGLIGIGPASVPLALDALRSGTHFARESGVAVLQGLNAVPTSGSDMVWCRLANLTVGENPVVDPAKDTGLAHIDNMEALLEALVHEQREVRDYALLALASIGEPAATPTMAAAKQNAGLDAKMWINGCFGWSGAPSWQLDLWAAATTLDPGFRINKRITSALKPHSHSAEQMMKSKEFQPHREYIPLLIAQFASHGSEFATGESKLTFFGIEFLIETSSFTATGESQDKIERQRTKRCRRLAAEHLIKADYRATLPLLAALNDKDLETAAHSARTLVKICGGRAEEPIVTSFTSRLNNREELSGSLFHDAMLDLGIPTLEPLLLKIRPNKTQALRTARQHYPDVAFKNIPIEAKIVPALKVAPFRLAYFKDNRNKELRIIFRPDENGNWVPTPPLADTLP